MQRKRKDATKLINQLRAQNEWLVEGSRLLGTHDFGNDRASGEGRYEATDGGT